MGASVVPDRVPAPPGADPALAAVAAAALPLTGADISGVLLTEPDGERAQVHACAGRWTVHSANLRVRRGHGLAGRIMQTHKPWKVDDYALDRTVDSEEFRPVLSEDGTVAGLGAPILDGDVLVGVLMVWSSRRCAFDAGATQALADLAGVAAAAVVNGRLAAQREAELAELTRRHGDLTERAALCEHGRRVREELSGPLLAGQDMAALLAVVCAHTGGPAAVLEPTLAEHSACGAVGPIRERVAGHLRRARGARTNGAAPDGARGEAVLPPAAGCPSWTLLRALVADGDALGWLAIGLPRAPTPADHETADQARQACALYRARERAVLVARSGVYADFVWQLLDGLVDEPVAQLRARRLGVALPARLRVVLVPLGRDVRDGPEPDPDRHRPDALVTAAERLARAGGATALAGTRGSTLALILGPGPGGQDGADAARAVVDAVVRGLRRHAPGSSGASGVSASVDFSADLRAARRQAEHALAAAALRIGGPGGRCPAAGPVLFEDLGLMRFLLVPHDRTDQLHVARSVLGPVLDYDREHHTELVGTLRTYLDEGGSLTRTAGALFVHPKTVRYRLRRVEELSGRDLSDQRDRFDAQLAIAILQARELDPGQDPLPGTFS